MVVIDDVRRTGIRVGLGEPASLIDELQLARRSPPVNAGAQDMEDPGTMESDAGRDSIDGGTNDQPKTAVKTAFSETSGSASAS